MARSPELSGAIAVNSSRTSREDLLDVYAVAEKYIPRALRPGDVSDHEGIHAGLGDEGEVKLVTIVPGPGYGGLTIFHRPNAVAAMGPHSVGAHGTGWDVMVAHHLSGNAHSLESAARSAIREKYAEIVEISDEVAEKGTLSGAEIDAARRRGRMKREYGVTATVIARSRVTGEQRTWSGVKVDGDKTTVPVDVVDFSEKLRRRREEEITAKKAKQVETNADEQVVGKEVISKPNVIDINEARLRRRGMRSNLINGEPSETADEQTAEVMDRTKQPEDAAQVEPVTETPDDIAKQQLREKRIVTIREELASLEDAA